MAWWYWYRGHSWFTILEKSKKGSFGLYSCYPTQSNQWFYQNSGTWSVQKENEFGRNLFKSRTWQPRLFCSRHDPDKRRTKIGKIMKLKMYSPVDSNIFTADRTRLIPNFGFTSLLLIDGDLVLVPLVVLVSFTKRALDRWLLFLGS